MRRLAGRILATGFMPCTFSCALLCAPALAADAGPVSITHERCGASRAEIARRPAAPQPRLDITLWNDDGAQLGETIVWHGEFLSMCGRGVFVLVDGFTDALMISFAGGIVAALNLPLLNGPMGVTEDHALFWAQSVEEDEWSSMTLLVFDAAGQQIFRRLYIVGGPPWPAFETIGHEGRDYLIPLAMPGG